MHISGCPDDDCGGLDVIFVADRCYHEVEDPRPRTDGVGNEKFFHFRCQNSSSHGMLGWLHCVCWQGLSVDWTEFGAITNFGRN